MKKNLTKVAFLTLMTVVITSICPLVKAEASRYEVIQTKYSQLNEANWQIVWQDEFDGTELDMTKWNYVVSGGGFGNNEMQYYTNRPQNIRVENGNLVIQALKEDYGGEEYTSAKITTENKAYWTYGKYEMRAKLPEGKGLWPAWWMLPQNMNVYGGVWPVCGEIDLMEYKGSEPNISLGTIHYGNPWVYPGANYYLDSNDSFANDFHKFTVEWLPGEIRWYVDDTLFLIQQDWYSKSDSEAEKYPYPAPFNQDFYMILNLAVGGYFPGYPDGSPWRSDQYIIDYVRVYEYVGGYPEPDEPQPPTPYVNLVRNSSFDNGYDSWSLWTENGAQFYIDDNSCLITVGTVLPQPWSTQVNQKVPLYRDTDYRLSFRVMCSVDRQAKVALEDSNYNSYFSSEFDIGTQWQEVSYTFNSSTTNNNIKLVFMFGNVGNSPNVLQHIFLDDVCLEAISGNPAGQELIQNGSFDNNLELWSTWSENGGSFINDNNTCKIGITSTLPNLWSTQLYQMVPVVANKTYDLSFSIKSDMNRQCKLALEDPAQNYMSLFDKTFDITTDWQNLSYRFSPSISCNNTKLVFMLGNVGNTQNLPHNVYIDNVSLRLMD